MKNNFLENVDSKILRGVGVGCTIVGFAIGIIGDKISDEQNARLMKKEISEEIAKQLKKG